MSLREYFAPGAPAPLFLPERRLKAIAGRLGLPMPGLMMALLAHDIWPERFRRNQGVISAKNQAKLLGLRVFMAGCGGLGGEVANLLARAGIGFMRICDPDKFEESNLNRQRFCTEKTIGQSKATVTRAAINEIASWIEVEAIESPATPENLPDLLNGIDIAIDCLDSVARKKTLEQAASAAGIPYLHGAVLGQDGFAWLGAPGEGRLDKLYPDIPAEDKSLGANPVLAPTVAITAAIMCSLLFNSPDISGERPIYHVDCSAPQIDTFFHSE